MADVLTVCVALLGKRTLRRSLSSKFCLMKQVVAELSVNSIENVPILHIIVHKCIIHTYTYSNNKNIMPRLVCHLQNL